MDITIIYFLTRFLIIDILLAMILKCVKQKKTYLICVFFAICFRVAEREVLPI